MRLLKAGLEKVGLLSTAKHWRETAKRLAIPAEIDVVVDGVPTWFHVETSMEWDHLRSVDEQRAIREVIERTKPRSVFWDIGGGMGLYSCIVANHCPDAIVVCFEPHPGRYLRIVENVERNHVDNVSCYNFALSDDSGTIELPMDYAEPNTSRLLSGTTGVISSKRHSGQSVVDAGVVPPDGLKIDVEGGEYDVLVGMGTLLDSVKFLLVEVHPTLMDRNPSAVDDLLRERGFDVKLLSERGNQRHLLAVRD